VYSLIPPVPTARPLQEIREARRALAAERAGAEEVAREAERRSAEVGELGLLAVGRERQAVDEQRRQLVESIER
jgi:hypothetical protein